MKIVSKGVELHVTDNGSGDIALVFMHFWGGSSATWSSVINLLSHTFRCVAIDARGSGESAVGGQGYRTADHADDVYNVIKELNLKRVILVGHSMGGKTAQLLASRLNQEVEALALVASAPLAPMNISEEQRSQMRMAYSSRESVLWTLENVLTAGHLTAQQQEMLVRDALRVSDDAADGWIFTASREDLRAAAEHIHLPIIIMAGEHDRVDPPAVVQQAIAGLYPWADVHIIPGKGHLLPVEAAQTVANHLSTFASSIQG
ncbi:alpha/beta fold hydrolase [Pantoea phytobeneficialis]|uniref:Alpha/beta hydrolase n=1 Tax=Pantoea phytobeneficialis TaxID=2052056 RepID=A0AAP9H9N3_9GAMM|nr:alpha/beta hydrolase [Pantoea phytobeneficialis]MDO6407136.1 alpha/beta hydrolase [Pantoea phytobeneficialis]QGR09109.1 alpha/beta hydrolase [Pantoea phytobeneficialis]